jgi:hypothetical protein
MNRHIKRKHAGAPVPSKESNKMQKESSSTPPFSQSQKYQTSRNSIPKQPPSFENLLDDQIRQLKKTLEIIELMERMKYHVTRNSSAIGMSRNNYYSNSPQPTTNVSASEISQSGTSTPHEDLIGCVCKVCMTASVVPLNFQNHGYPSEIHVHDPIKVQEEYERIAREQLEFLRQQVSAAGTINTYDSDQRNKKEVALKILYDKNLKLGLRSKVFEWSGGRPVFLHTTKISLELSESSWFSKCFPPYIPRLTLQEIASKQGENGGNSSAQLSPINRAIDRYLLTNGAEPFLPINDAELISLVDNLRGTVVLCKMPLPARPQENSNSSGQQNQVVSHCQYFWVRVFVVRVPEGPPINQKFELSSNRHRLL